MREESLDEREWIIYTETRYAMLKQRHIMSGILYPFYEPTCKEKLT